MIGALIRFSLSVFILYRLRNKFLQPILISLDFDSWELYQYSRRVCGPMKIPKFTPAPRKLISGPHDCEADALPRDHGHHHLSSLFQYSIVNYIFGCYQNIYLSYSIGLLPSVLHEIPYIIFKILYIFFFFLRKTGPYISVNLTDLCHLIYENSLLIENLSKIHKQCTSE